MSKPGLCDDACRDGQRKYAHEDGKHEHREIAGAKVVRGVEIHQFWVERAWLVAGLSAQFFGLHCWVMARLPSELLSAYFNRSWTRFGILFTEPFFSMASR